MAWGHFYGFFILGTVWTMNSPLDQKLMFFVNMSLWVSNFLYMSSTSVPKFLVDNEFRQWLGADMCSLRNQVFKYCHFRLCKMIQLCYSIFMLNWYLPITFVNVIQFVFHWGIATLKTYVSIHPFCSPDYILPALHITFMWSLQMGLILSLLVLCLTAWLLFRVTGIHRLWRLACGRMMITFTRLMN